MATKDINKNLDEIFNTCKKGDILTFEDIAREFDRQPTLVQARRILRLSQKHKIRVVSSSEYAKDAKPDNLNNLFLLIESWSVPRR